MFLLVALCSVCVSSVFASQDSVPYYSYPSPTYYDGVYPSDDASYPIFKDIYSQSHSLFHGYNPLNIGGAEHASVGLPFGVTPKAGLLMGPVKRTIPYHLSSYPFISHGTLRRHYGHRIIEHDSGDIAVPYYANPLQHTAVRNLHPFGNSVDGVHKSYYGIGSLVYHNGEEGKFVYTGVGNGLDSYLQNSAFPFSTHGLSSSGRVFHSAHQPWSLHKSLPALDYPSKKLY